MLDEHAIRSILDEVLEAGKLDKKLTPLISPVD